MQKIFQEEETREPFLVSKIPPEIISILRLIPLLHLPSQKLDWGGEGIKLLTLGGLDLGILICAGIPRGRLRNFWSVPF